MRSTAQAIGAMVTGYNAVSGFGMNPYDPRRDPREATFDGLMRLKNENEMRKRRGMGAVEPETKA